MLAQSPHIDIKIYYETSDYLVIYKPKWVLSHPKTLWEVEQPSIVGWLYHRSSLVPSSGSFIRAGLVHRLDKETDGLMIVVLTEKWLHYFRDLFDKKAQSALDHIDFDQLHKYYRAKCVITNQGKDRLISHADLDYPVMIKSLIYPKTSTYGYPKMGITRVISVEMLDQKHVVCTLELLTGRTHQLRYHLAEIWLPIVWDELYGTWADNQKKQHIQLTAYKLDFIDCSGRRVQCEIT